MMKLNVNGSAHESTPIPRRRCSMCCATISKLNAAKFGCGLGQCGACTVMVDGKAVFSCLTPMLAARGPQITTVEGLGTIDEPGADAARLHRRAGGAMRLLHRRHDDAGAGAAASASPTPTDAEIRADAGAQSVPLRHPYAHPARGAPRRAADARPPMPRRPQRERTMNALSSRRRRRVLAGGGALVVGFSLCRVPCAQDQAAPAAAPAPNLPGSLRDDAVSRRLDPHRCRRQRSRVFTGKAELGQGIKTALIQIAAEELEVALCVASTLITADTGRTANEGYTAGSQSMQDSGTAIRNAAAQVREILIDAGRAAARSCRPTVSRPKTAR